MKKFNIGKKLKEYRQPLQPPEIGRKPVDKKTIIIRKWFFRFVYTVVILLILWLFLKNIFITQTKGLVKIREVTITAPESGYFRPLCKEGEIVVAERPLGEIYNPELDEELRTLKSTLEMLTDWKEKIIVENEKRREFERINNYIKMLSATTIDSTRLKAQIEQAEKLKNQLEEQLKRQEKKVDNLQKFVKSGVASILDLQYEEERLLSLRSRLIEIEEKIALLESKLKAIDTEKRLLTQYPSIDPLIMQIVTVEERISDVQRRINVLSSSLKSTIIKLPYKVKIQNVEVKDKYVTVGETVITALKPDAYYIEAYVEKDKIDEVIKGREVKIILPGDREIFGIIEDVSSSYILKPHILVGPLEKRDLVLPVKIIPEEGVENVLHNNMPVEIIF